MRTRLGLKLLGLSALVMGVMAIGTAGVAQAEVCWGYKNGEALPCFSVSLAPIPVFALENSTGTLLIGNLNIEILCTGLALIEGGGLSGSLLLGRAEFSGCIALSKTPKLTVLANCTPKDPTTGEGRIRTEKSEGSIVLHNGEPMVLIGPDQPNSNLAKLFLGTKCGVAEEIIVTGFLVLSDTGGKKSFEEHKLSHLAQEFPSLKLMKVGGVAATIDGTANVTLAAPHNELFWAGHAD